MLLALTGFVMIGLLMYFLLKGKAIPVTLFVVLPIIGALINGFGIADITDYIKSGVSTTWGMAALFVFVITYFGIMTDVGMFDSWSKSSSRSPTAGYWASFWSSSSSPSWAIWTATAPRPTSSSSPQWHPCAKS